MFHIQDKGRFELYRATYVRACVRRETRAECNGGLSFIFSLSIPSPQKSLSQDRASTGDTGDIVWATGSDYGTRTGTLGPVLSSASARTAEWTVPCVILDPGTRPLEHSSNAVKHLYTPKLMACVCTFVSTERNLPTTERWLIRLSGQTFLPRLPAPNYLIYKCAWWGP